MCIRDRYVSLPRKSDGPNAPNMEFDDPPPNAEPKSEPLPCCNKTKATIITAKIIQRTFIKIIILNNIFSPYVNYICKSRAIQ